MNEQGYWLNEVQGERIDWGNPGTTSTNDYEVINTVTLVNTWGRSDNGQMGLAGHATIGVGTSGPFKLNLFNYGLVVVPKKGWKIW